ncbi:MAG: hypothetical protein ACMXYC_01045 [Candidatus Woesearchaeota archaeon]
MDLKLYVEQALQNGYDKTTIKNYLLQQGISPLLIEQVFDEIQPTQHTSHTFSPILLYGILGFTLLLLGVGFFMFIISKDVSNESPSVTTPLPAPTIPTQQSTDTSLHNTTPSSLSSPDTTTRPQVNFAFELRKIRSTAQVNPQLAAQECEIFTDNYYDQCIYQIAIDSLQQDFCLRIKNDMLHDKCLWEYGLNSRDFNCNIYKTALQEECYRYV